MWLADSEPVPKEAGLSIEGDMPFPRYMINVAADIPFEEVPLQPWAEELFMQRLAERRHGCVRSRIASRPGCRC